MNATTVESLLAGNMEPENVGMTTVLKHPYVEIPFLFIVIIVGTIGNVSIIGAVSLDRRLRSMGIKLITNLAVVDLIITTWFLSVILANVLNGYVNVFNDVTWLCDVSGFLLSYCCQVTSITLLSIAFDRFWKITKPRSYKKYFNRRNTCVIIAFIWMTSFLISLPLITGWFDSEDLLKFDAKMLACMWNDHLEVGYNIFFVVSAIFLPILFAFYFYFITFRYLREHRRPIKEIASPNGSSIRTNSRIYVESSSYADDVSSSSISQSVKPHHSRQNSINSHKTARLRRADKRERNLLTSLVVVVIMFVLFWLPYGLMTLIKPEASSIAKRICGWIAFSNSAVNGVIFGILNRHFRQGYVTFYKKVFFFITCPFSRRSPNNERTQSVKFG